MYITITNQMISQFLSGFITVVVLIAVGAFLSLVLRPMAQKSPFTRLALILALSPLSLVKFFESPDASEALYLYAMIVTLLGISIDGINFLLMPKPKLRVVEREEKVEETHAESSPGVIVWEKAE